MFYSSLILTKKGPLAKVWLAAHWGDKKLNRPQIFATDITAAVNDIVAPPVPLALRMSGHLLLGVVRIYSRKVKYLMQDAHEAMLKINSACRNTNNTNNSNNNNNNSSNNNNNTDAGINMEPRSGRQSEGALNVSGFGEYQEGAASFPVFRSAGGGFQIPFDLNDETYNAEDWIPAQLQEDDDDDDDDEEEDDEDDDDDEEDDNDMMDASQDGSKFKQSRRSKANKQQQQQQQQDQKDGNSPVGGVENFTLKEAWDPTDGRGKAASGLGDGGDDDEDEDAPIWDPSDDDDDDEDEAEGGADGKKKKMKNNESLVSDIEAPRDAANASMSTANDPNNQSDLLAKVNDEQDDDGFMPSQQQDDDEEDFNITMNDDEDLDEQQQQRLQHHQNANDASSLNQSGISGMSVSRDESGLAGAAAGGLEEEDDDPQSPENQRKRKRAARAKGKARAKKRRRRHVEMDTRVRMTQREYHSWIKDTSDLVVPVPHPASLTDAERAAYEQHLQRQQQQRQGGAGGAGWSLHRQSNEDLLMSHLDLTALYARPTMGDDGQLAPALLRLFGRHMGHVAGHDFPYEIEEKENDDNDKAAAAAAQNAADQDDEMQQDDQVGGLRDGNKSAADEEDDGFPPPNFGDDFDEQQQEQQQDEEEDFVASMDDDEEEEQNLLTQPQEGETKKLATTATGSMADASDEEDGSVFSLGLVNDVLGDSLADEDDPRQLAGDELVSSNSKWHAHTIKVYNMLKTAMAAPGEHVAAAAGEDGGAAAAAGATKPSHLSFQGLSKNCSRRTAAGVFFELLQLKTWDYIDVDQNESFGNIIITPGPKFGEAAPSD